MENKDTKSFGLSSFVLKLIAATFMTLDHVALLFIERGSGDIPLAYYLLRAIGKMAFPIYAFLAFEGAYKTSNSTLYLIRLGFLALLMDGFGFAFGAISNIQVSQNPLIGNAITDMFMGVLLVTLLRRKDGYSILALIPLIYEIFSNYPLNASWGTLFKADWGTFSIFLFLTFFIGKEFTDFYLRKKALHDGLEEDVYLIENNKYYRIISALAVVFTGILFYFIYRINYTAFIIPNEFVPIGTYSILSAVFILLYNGKKGYSSKKIQYSFYAYYPLHLLVLGILSFFFGIFHNFA